MKDLRLEYDDQLEDVIGKVNGALEDHSLEFRENDDESGDGFVVYDLVKV